MTPSSQDTSEPKPTFESVLRDHRTLQQKIFESRLAGRDRRIAELQTELWAVKRELWALKRAKAENAK